VRDILDRLEPSVLLCGHSYGGAVITEAASGPHPAVRYLVYLAAAVPGGGDSMASLMPADATINAEKEPVIFRDDGLAVLDRDATGKALFNDCDPDRAQEALDQLRPSNVSAVGTQPVRGAAWAGLPATYVRGSQDRMPEAVAAGFLERAEVIDLPTGHCPHWSRPDLVAELLTHRARSLVA
jgi:pimeloyl-ACP methyl ester carboxylesterase